MKTLSLKQPFAELILQGKKTIELRKWNTHVRGEFLIHASQKLDQKAMQHFGFTTLPTGAILGKATLSEVKKYMTAEEHAKDREKHCASSQYGQYGFILKEVQRLSKPIPAKGKLNFWDFDLNS